MDAVLPRVEAAGGALLALTPDTLGHGAELQTRLGLRFKVLSDVDCGVALQFGTAYRVPADYRDALLRFGIDLQSRHGDGPGLLPMPATFVCDRAGIIRFAHVSADINVELKGEDQLDMQTLHRARDRLAAWTDAASTQERRHCRASEQADEDRVGGPAPGRSV